MRAGSVAYVVTRVRGCRLFAACLGMTFVCARAAAQDAGPGEEVTAELDLTASADGREDAAESGDPHTRAGESEPASAGGPDATAGAGSEDPRRAAAREHLDQGQAFFDAANYDAALVEFEAAHDVMDGMSDRYLLLYNVGQCYERTFRYTRALEFYRRYLAEGGPDAQDHGEVEATIRTLEGLLGTVTVSVNVGHAEVWVDGLPVGEAPGDVLVTGGVHTFELRAAGFVPTAREVQVPARGHASIDVTMGEVSTFEGIDPALFASTAAIAGLTLVAGVVLGSVALADSSEVTGRVVDFRTAGDRSRIDAEAAAADVLYAVGGGLAVVSVVFAVVTDWDGPSERAGATTTAYVSPRAGGGTLVVEGTW